MAKNNWGIKGKIEKCSNCHKRFKVKEEGQVVCKKCAKSDAWGSSY